jgi:predicted RNA-binding protein with PIN domain
MDTTTLGSSAGEKTKTADNKAEQLAAELTKPREPAALTKDMTADRVTTFVRGAAVNSAREIDALIGDLEGLREKLVTDSGRIEQDVVEFAALNQSVINLTKIISDSVARAKDTNAPG